MKETREAPLTQTQLGIYIESVKSDIPDIYHVPTLARLVGVTDAPRLAESVEWAISAYPSLSARIVTDAEGVPRVSDFSRSQPVRARVLEMTETELLAAPEKLVTPFSLEGGELAHIDIIKTPENIYLFIDVQHTVFDGWSRRVIFEAIIGHYCGAAVAPEEVTIYDVAREEEELRRTEALARARASYAALLEDSDGGVEIAPDCWNKPEAYGTVSIATGISRATYLDYCASARLPQSVPASAAMAFVLGQFCHASNVTYATIYHGRKGERYKHTSGMLVKTIPVHAAWDKSVTVAEFIGRVQKNIKIARDNDIYSFAEISAAYGINSEFIFAYQGDFKNISSIHGVKVEPLPIRTVSTGSKIQFSVSFAEDALVIDIEYRSDLYSRELMEELAGCFARVLQGFMLADADAAVESIALLSEEAEKSMIELGDGGPSLAGAESGIVSLFRRAAGIYPDKLAAAHKDCRLTFRELDSLTDDLAAILRAEYGVCPGRTVGVLIERSEKMVIYPLAIMKAGAAYMPLDPHFPEERLLFMLEDAGADMVIEDPGLARKALPSFRGRIFSGADADRARAARTAPACELRPDSRMVVLYTSGSTGKPKGVALTQGNIANYCAAYAKLINLRDSDRVGGYATFGFDAHMMDIYPALLAGASVHIIPADIRLDLAAMHQFIEREEITALFMTTQIAWQMATLFDYTTLRVLCTGGEKLPPIKELPYEFLNLYGPTECSVIATAFKPHGATDGRLIGRPLPGYQVRIVDQRLRPAPAGVPGELIILGQGVGCGYLNRPGLTAEKFIEIDGIRAYRTGDLCRFTASGDIEYMGRMDGMVKLRGLRIELGEIEAVASAHPGVRTFTAAVKETGGMENLVGYYVEKTPGALSPEDLREFMKQSLTEFMIPAVIMPLEAIPLTPNGKVDRRALPAPEFGSAALVPPDTPMETGLLGVVTGVLGNSDIGVTTNLIAAGLTSLMAMRLVVAIMKELGVKITAKAVMSAPTIREIAAELDASGKTMSNDGAGVMPKRRYYPLTENQRGIYIDWERNREALQYNIPEAFRFAAGVDAEKLRQALFDALEAHPVLKTRLITRNGDIAQERRDSDVIDIPVIDLDAAPSVEFFQSRVRPFNLLGEPLFRAEIYRHGGYVYLLRDTHHIIYDGVSAMVFNNDLAAAYDGARLETEAYTALDHALTEKNLLESEEFDKAEEWFNALLAGTEPTSWPHSAQPDGNVPGSMGTVRLTLPAGGIRAFCRAGGITPSNYVLSAFLQLLHRLTREENVQITTVNNGRGDARLLSSVGMFVKTLPVVSRCKNPALTPLEFARQIQTQFLGAQERDFYPFTTLVEKNGVRPEIMYVFEGGIDLGGKGSLASERIGLALDAAKVPLTVLIFEPTRSDYEIAIEYDASLYGHADMELLAEMLRTLCLSLTSARTVAQGGLINDRQEAVLAAMRYGEKLDIPYKSFIGALEMRVDQYPERIALAACDRRLDYAGFDAECNRIAHALAKRGVGRGDRVVILLPRLASLVTAIYGAMKTGAAYIPCDPAYPADRIRLITEDSEAKTIITTSDKLALYPGKAVDIDELLQETDASRPDVVFAPDDIAYMIYTSGSTGRPKGVMIHQEAICNYLYGYYSQYFRDRPDIRTKLLLITISFDASLQDLGLALTSGMTLVLANEDECKDAALLSRLILENEVDSFDITPSRLEAMLDMPEFRKAVSRLAHLNIGGEGFQNSLIAKLYNAGFKGMAINEYGPTECTVGSNNARVTPFDPIVAGPPLTNEGARIIDAWGSELPVGVAGELFIFGRSVGKGYNNLPERTAEAFVTFRGERAYRTGDLARWNDKGEIVTLGRIDHQVKLRGLRIELGEIESVAKTFPGIRAAAADVREINKIQHLCLYYTASEPIDPAALRARLAASLTDYMTPDAYTQVAEMPLTPNGKTNRKALPEPELAPLTPYVEPEGGLEKTIADAFASVLQAGKVGANDDFFLNGGTSISAIKVVAALAAAGLKISYKNVFDARTPRGIAALVEGQAAGRAEQAARPPVEKSESGYADILSRNRLESFYGGRTDEMGDVLITGATGFLGIHMLHHLLVSSNSRIYCLLRGKNELSAASRLRTLLFYYFNSAFEDAFAAGRLSVIEGDVTCPIAGIRGDVSVRTVINCAANVKHFSAGDDIEQVNVESVRHLIDFCLARKTRLIHVSTISVAGESINGRPDPSILLTERMLDFGQNLSNQYVSSKYHAECLVLRAIREHGLAAKIMRVGNLSPRSSDGEFQINFKSNAFMGRLRAYAAIGCAPYAVLDQSCEFSPIDEVCRAILLLCNTPREMTVFQPCNNHRIPLGDVLGMLDRLGVSIKAVEMDEYSRRLKEIMADPARVDALQPLLAYDSGEAVQAAYISYTPEFTNQILYRLGFRWSYTSHDYIAQFLKAIYALNFFEA